MVNAVQCQVLPACSNANTKYVNSDVEEVRECHATSAARSLQKKKKMEHKKMVHSTTTRHFQCWCAAHTGHSAATCSSHISIRAFNNVLPLPEEAPLAHSLPTTTEWFLYTSDMNSILLIKANGNNGNSNKNKHCIQYLNNEFSGQLV